MRVNKKVIGPAGRLSLWEEWSLGFVLPTFYQSQYLPDAMVRGGQRLLGRLPVRHLFWTDCAGSKVADTWVNYSTMIDVAAMTKAHSCQQRNLGNVRAPPNLDDGILWAKSTENSR